MKNEHLPDLLFYRCKPPCMRRLCGPNQNCLPCKTMSMNLFHANIPFEYAVTPSPGFILVCLEGKSTNLFAAADGGRHPYTWIIPFEPGGLTGNFSWFTQAAHAGDDRYTVQTRFILSVDLTFGFVAHTGPAVGMCSVEFGVDQKIDAHKKC